MYGKETTEAFKKISFEGLRMNLYAGVCFYMMSMASP